MENLPTKTIGIVLIDGYADWEFGFLSGGAVEHMGAKVVFLSPGGKIRPVDWRTAGASRTGVLALMRTWISTQWP